MPSTVRTQRRYDHCLRELVCKTKSVEVALCHGVPRSTARGWLTAAATPVVTLKVANEDTNRLRQEVVALRLRVETARWWVARGRTARLADRRKTAPPASMTVLALPCAWDGFASRTLGAENSRRKSRMSWLSAPPATAAAALGLARASQCRRRQHLRRRSRAAGRGHPPTATLVTQQRLK